MENKKKSLPKLFSRVTLSMILTSSIVLNSGYAAVATIKSSDSEVQKEDTSVSERRTFRGFSSAIRPVWLALMLVSEMRRV